MLHRSQSVEGGERLPGADGGVQASRWEHSPGVLPLTGQAELSWSDDCAQLGAERFRAPEILFNPEIIGMEDPGVHQVVVDSINRVDLDLRKSLFSNIVLSGGTTLCRGAYDVSLRLVTCELNWGQGFSDRLLNEVKKVAVKDVKLKIYAPPERKYSTWIGGSILAGLNTFKKASH